MPPSPATVRFDKQGAGRFVTARLSESDPVDRRVELEIPGAGETMPGTVR
ncbi:hypothetical protein M2284_001506 [Rhodococcus sp. LBL1]|jgi:hypothetical protein|uniref:Uncharacterized protein n=1 Tax=Prescottella agglutinans TaxID=1644129 RepID=A0ABT6MHW2_9NOCA|nr:hypothetical protein [Prescottella agglutinans]MDH6677308.1 hypothetical protein [Rhodococcus sp. LBL1]MDH6682398.1 hypothetical protein [Rhodococcus sp. LBL2]